MKKFCEYCFKVRVVGGEVGGTAAWLFLIAFGMYKAWQEFIAPLLK
jgi:hypothetical protein